MLRLLENTGVRFRSLSLWVSFPTNVDCMVWLSVVLEFYRCSISPRSINMTNDSSFHDFAKLTGARQFRLFYRPSHHATTGDPYITHGTCLY